MDESGSLRAIDGMGGTGGTGSVSGASAMAWHGCHWQTEIWACWSLVMFYNPVRTDINIVVNLKNDINVVNIKLFIEWERRHGWHVWRRGMSSSLETLLEKRPMENVEHIYWILARWDSRGLELCKLFCINTSSSTSVLDTLPGGRREMFLTDSLHSLVLGWSGAQLMKPFVVSHFCNFLELRNAS